MIILFCILLFVVNICIIFDVPETIYNYLLNRYSKKKIVIKTEYGWHFKEIIRSDGTMIYRSLLNDAQYKQEMREQKLKRITQKDD